MNLPRVEWKGVVGKTSGFQVMVNKLVWENGYTQVVNCPTREDALLDVYLLRPEISIISCNALPGISGHYRVLL